MSRSQNKKTWSKGKTEQPLFQLNSVAVFKYSIKMLNEFIVA